MAKKQESSFLGNIFKWAGIALGAILLVLVIAPFFVNWNALKDKGCAALSQSLHHKVSIGGISANIFQGVVLSQVEVSNAAGFGKDPLFSNDAVVIRPSLLSLFSGKIVISEILFKSPKILIVKNAKGIFNFSDMSAPSKAQPKKIENKEGASSGGGALPNFLLESFHIAEGNFTYRDLGTGKLSAIQGLDVMLSAFSLAAGGNSNLKVHFNADLNGKTIPIDLNTDFGLDLAGQKLDLKSLALTLPSVSVNANGTVSQFSGDPDLKIRAQAAVKMDSIVADLVPPDNLQALPADFKASGGIQLEASLNGRPSHPESMDFAATLIFDKLGVSASGMPPIDSMSGTLQAGPTQTELKDLAFNVAGSPIHFQFAAKDYTMKGLLGPRKSLKLKLSYLLSSDKLVLDPFLAIAAATSASPSAATEAATPAKAQGTGLEDFRDSIPAGLSLDGQIKVGSAQLKQIVTGPFTHVVSLHQRKFKSELQLDVFDGHVHNLLTADLGKLGPPHSEHVEVSNIQFAKAVDEAAASFPERAYLQQLKGKVFGSFGLSMSGHGLGYEAPALDKNIVLDGNFQMKDGVLKSMDFEQKIASAIPYPQAQDLLRKDLSFGQMIGSFSMKNQNFTLSKFYLGSGRDWREGEIYVQANGQQILGGALDYKIVPHFNPRSLQLDGVAAQGFNDDKGWATFDYLEYKGADTASAKADFTGGMKKAATKVLQNQAQQVIQNNGQSLIKQLPGGLQNLFGH